MSLTQEARRPGQRGDDGPLTVGMARPYSRPSLGVEGEGSTSPKHPPLRLPRPRGGVGLYLLLAQGQVQERPPAQRLHVPRLGPQHGVEVEQGGLPLAQERVASGAGEQGLAGLAT